MQIRAWWDVSSAHLPPGGAAAQRDKGGWIISNHAQPLRALQAYERKKQPDTCTTHALAGQDAQYASPTDIPYERDAFHDEDPYTLYESAAKLRNG